MTRLLSNDEIESLISIEDCLEVLERSYLELDAGDAITRPRTDSLVANADGSTYILKTVDGILPAAGVAAVRINSDLLSWPETAAGAKREKLPRAGGQWVGLVLLFSASTGEPLAIFPDGVPQRLRVAATSVLAMRRMARRDARTLALIGSGWQAGSQLAAALAVHDFADIRCFSSTSDRREQFAKEMTVLARPRDRCRGFARRGGHRSRRDPRRDECGTAGHSGSLDSARCPCRGDQTRRNADRRYRAARPRDHPLARLDPEGAAGTQRTRPRARGA